MRQIFFALAFALTACATPAVRADALSADPGILRGCALDAGKDRDALEQCVGLVTRHCTAEEGGSNAMSDVLCHSAEADAWQALIDENTARIAAADAVDGALLVGANQAWMHWREAECNYRAYEYGGGSGEQYDRIDCHLRLTATRAIDLIVN